MDEDEDDEDRGVPHADEVLRTLFDRLREGVRGRRLDRLRRAEADVRRCLDLNAHRLLTTLELELLVLERHFEPVDATARVAPADVLLLLLPILLDDPRWYGADVEDRRLRIRLVEALAAAVVRLPELRGGSLACGLIEVELAVRRARAGLRAGRRSTAGA